jgi:hypothetical protein
MNDEQEFYRGLRQSSIGFMIITVLICAGLFVLCWHLK